ncbi:LysR family transcriptional regulator [Microterricola viridarii]|uniref:DNA-binding transcriptional regulator, LysR family n=1 Tax=Microterricola viridarii TaxID=412690 RepID=A0A1H1ZP46_9MICO|nr:LysR family transcriptional regulator [Microterricola viridarii]SDT35347.1 DNA-binding transcriptional regulator, LysR family [Microterricola viridarii]
MINPIHLRTLLETVRLGSFAAAANRLGYTASAVSQQMAALERAVGVPLFERSGRSAHPTEAATAMARHAVRVLADIDALLAEASSAHGATVVDLRLAVFPSLARPLLARLQERPEWGHSDVDLRFWVADPSPTIREIRAGREFDVALVYQVGDTALSWPQAMRQEWLGDDEYRVVVPAGWGLHAHEPVTIHQLANLPWVVHHPGTSDAAIIDRLFRGHDLRPRTVAHSDDYTVTLQLVAGGFAASFVPMLALHQLPDGVSVLDVPELRLARRVFALTPTEGASPATGAFLGAVGEILTELGVTRTDAP